MTELNRKPFLEKAGAVPLVSAVQPFLLSHFFFAVLTAKYNNF